MVRLREQFWPAMDMPRRSAIRFALLVLGLLAAAWLSPYAAQPLAQNDGDSCAIIGDIHLPPRLADLSPTLDRIRAGEYDPHPRDGDTFYNREQLLPIKPEGYYREYVHPTPGIDGPGMRRLVRGCGGDLYFSPDHYRSFVPIN